ncbi:MAG: class II fructose-bisphosphate aldolase, partial [Pseudomonadota bacterium]
RAFHDAAPVDCLAVSVGNVHLHTEQAVALDFDLLDEMVEAVHCPLVLHGGSGVMAAHRTRAARTHRVRKINLGTELRQIHGQALRAALAHDPDVFDRIKIQAPVTDALQAAAEGALTTAWEAAP